MDTTLREAVLADPDRLLEDPDVMRALAEAGGRAMGANVVDLRGLAMERLEKRLGRLEDTHRHVVAAAYDNLAGTQLVHRAVLRLLEAPRFEALVRDLGGEVAAILRVDGARLVLESPGGMADDAAAAARLGPALAIAGPGWVDAYVGGRGRPRAVTLRPVPAAGAPGEPEGGAWGALAAGIASEATLRLDLGEGQRPGLLLLGSRDAGHFAPSQGTDLLRFLGAALERVLRGWLG